MFDVVTIMSGISVLFGITQSIKENKEPIAPPIHNFDLYRKDILDGCGTHQLHRNQLSGRYRKPDNINKPHKNNKGQIIIEDMEKYRDDAARYGVVQAQIWIREGKYNK